MQIRENGKKKRLKHALTTGSAERLKVIGAMQTNGADKVLGQGLTLVHISANTADVAALLFGLRL